MISQGQKMKMRQKLTKQQVLVAHLLELSSENLEQEIKKEIEENPFLEEVIEDTATVASSDAESESNSDTAALLDPNNEYYSRNAYDYDDYRSPKKQSDETDDTPFQQADETSFQTQLLEQLNLKPITERQQIIGNELIGNIDEAGYMSRNIGIIADDLAIHRNIEVSEQEVEEVLTIIQTFDPAGVGARNLQECLSIQLHRKTTYSPALQNATLIIDKHFDNFANKRYDKICRQLNIDNNDLQQAIELIRSLNPKPCDNNSSTAQSIIPDFYVHRQGDQLSFSINERNLPKLRTDNIYIERLRNEATKQPPSQQRATQDFVEKNSKNAELFISAIQQRYSTLQLVMSAIIKHQRKYFLTGITSDLRPMLQKNIAEETGLDISTVSRVVNQKYVLSEHGVKLLKDFFSNALAKDDGSDVATRAIKDQLKTIIDNEDKTSPITDEELRLLLLQKGFPMARRTVAKYREALDIPTARLRKEL